jgi:transcription elongation factor GreA
MIEAKKKLEDDIRTAEYELKVELPKEIQRAREWGDLRENAEYKAAKERQSFLQARIAQLQSRLAGLSMLNLDSIPRDKVGLGSTVHVKDEDTGEEEVFEIVTSEESEPEKGRISPSSPIGRCLLNKKVGEVAEVRVPKGTRYVEIVKLSTMHDLV